MSAWSEVTGKVRLSKNSHFSIKKACLDICDESIVNVTKSGDFQDIRWVFSLDGCSAAEAVDEFVKRLKDADKTVYIDLDANIRFLA